MYLFHSAESDRLTIHFKLVLCSVGIIFISTKLAIILKKNGRLFCHEISIFFYRTIPFSSGHVQEFMLVMGEDYTNFQND